ncbi:MAG: hypothetical protein QMD13_07340 [Candidatus Bathyarchaeia archaeon]|nr:hypothetical protein [Candidatus Bathyarchaeia archaeon]
MPEERKHTVFLGLAFLILLVLSPVENTVFFNILNDTFPNHLLAVRTLSIPGILVNSFILLGMFFINNVLFVSLILLGMTFYVNLVLIGFFKGEYEYIVLEHPRIFAIVFTIVVLFLSILRTSNLIYGGISIAALPPILLLSAPMGMVEGYGIYFTIKKTLNREMTMKSLVFIYVIFLIAAIMEVVFINLLIRVTTG